MGSLKKLKTEDIQSLVRNLRELSKFNVEQGPKTDDELHEWIKTNLGLNISRVAVCVGHNSPFEFLADIYFERVTSAIAMASRGSGKSALSAVIHLLNSIFKPECEGITVAAVESQSKMVYENFKKFLKSQGNIADVHKHPLIESIIQEKTVFRNGSSYKIIIGTLPGVNGPHGNKLHTDEVEVMDELIFQESRSISMSKTVVDKETGQTREIRSQDWITSTRKFTHGLMQKLMDSIADAEKNGYEPPFKLYQWCMVESCKRVDNCQSAYPDLKDHCNCDRVVNGAWDDGSPRRFSEVCKGRLGRSDGFIELRDIQKKFMDSDRNIWEAQHECLRPETGGMVFPLYERDKMGCKWYNPDPAYGPIYMGVDFGGTNPHAVSWYQVLRVDLAVHEVGQQKDEEPKKILKEGTRVCFDEVYVANISNVELGNLVKIKERNWRLKYKDFSVKWRFADVAAKAARLEWALMEMPTQFFATRDIPEQVKTVNDLLRDNMFAIDLTRVEMLPAEMERYTYPRKRPGLVDDPEKPVDDFNHQVSAMRYCLEHVKFLESGGPKNYVLPIAGKEYHTTANPAKSSAPRYLPRNYNV